MQEWQRDGFTSERMRFRKYFTDFLFGKAEQEFAVERNIIIYAQANIHVDKGIGFRHKGALVVPQYLNHQEPKAYTFNRLDPSLIPRYEKLLEHEVIYYHQKLLIEMTLNKAVVISKSGADVIALLPTSLHAAIPSRRLKRIREQTADIEQRHIDAFKTEFAQGLIAIRQQALLQTLE